MVVASLHSCLEWVEIAYNSTVYMFFWMELVSSFQLPTWKKHVQIPPPSSPKKTTAFLRKRTGPLQLQPDLWSHRHPSNGCRVADVFPAPICTFLDEIPVAQKLHFVVPGIVCALKKGLHLTNLDLSRAKEPRNEDTFISEPWFLIG